MAVSLPLSLAGLSTTYQMLSSAKEILSQDQCTQFPHLPELGENASRLCRRRCA
ncbi:hypothetical protein BDZ89DRAFT_1059847 [Hymenopellis radicata]|nr:hypothetical protein BDZ89DRAFT_1059847 [Hymenopellis radicata]